MKKPPAHGPTDSALAHLLAAISAKAVSFDGELQKADGFIDKVVDLRHRKDLRAFWDIIKEDAGKPHELGIVRGRIENWMRMNFPVR